jgi:hypothetical protein
VVLLPRRRLAWRGWRRARGRWFANGQDVDPVDLFRLVLHARFDAAHQCPDLTIAQPIVDADPRDQPHTMRWRWDGSWLVRTALWLLTAVMLVEYLGMPDDVARLETALT